MALLVADNRFYALNRRWPALSEEGIETVSLPHGILLDEGVQ